MRIKSISLSIIFTLFFVLLVLAHVQRPSAGTGTLKGSVKYAHDDSPLRRAFVFVHSEMGYGDQVVRLDENAQFEISLASGYYDVFATSNGFLPTCKKVKIIKGQTIEFAPKLQADLEHMED
ncbi:MAG TPA: hypothetical protein VG028_07480 [Terriglobia bacterium]|nr:hypothetical protein [Terriglobia bacterium]